MDCQQQFREQPAAVVSKVSIICCSFALLNEITLPLFRTMVRPHLEYGNSVWGPFNREDQKRIERVQRRATKLVATIGDRPCEERLRFLDLPSLYHRRGLGDMITVYQMLRQGVNLEGGS